MKKKIEFVRNCPLEAAPFESVFDDFYFNRNKTGSSPKRSIVDEFISRQIKCCKPLPKLLYYQDKCWSFSKNVYPDWESGHLHLKKTSKRFLHCSGAHFHTDLSIYDDIYHIDYYAIAYSGPRSGLSEVRVFQNGQLIGRGGRGHASICSFSQNLPFIVSGEDYILLFKEIERTPTETESKVYISFWQLCS